MPTRITNFLHDSVVTGAQTLGTAFDVADVHAHDLQAALPSFQKNKRNYRGIVEGIHIRLTSTACHLVRRNNLAQRKPTRGTSR